jgi:hypothetical protein
VCMDTGLFTVLPANDTGGPIGFWEARGAYGSIYNAGYMAANREATPRHGAHWQPTSVAKLHFPGERPEEYAYAARRIVTTGRVTLLDWGSTAAGKPGTQGIRKIRVPRPVG